MLYNLENQEAPCCEVADATTLSEICNHIYSMISRVATALHLYLNLKLNYSTPFHLIILHWMFLARDWKMS